MPVEGPPRVWTILDQPVNALNNLASDLCVRVCRFKRLAWTPGSDGISFSYEISLNSEEFTTLKLTVFGGRLLSSANA